MDRVLEWWRNVREAPPEEIGEGRGRPSPAYPLLAAGALAAVLYTWPSWNVLPAFAFYPLAAAVWITGLVAIRSMSFPNSATGVGRFMGDAGRRTGMIKVERVGAGLGLCATVASIVVPHLLPLGIAVSYGFIRLLISPHQKRELKRLRQPVIEPPQPLPSDEDGEFEQRDFRWTVRSGFVVDDHAISVKVHVPTYERLQRDNPQALWRGEVPLFEKWIVDGSTQEVDRTAYALVEISKERRYSTFAEISNALAFVQSIPYSLDKDSKGIDDYWRYPIETMYDETGDCEDTTILAAAVLRRLGHRVGTMLLPEHAALAVEAPPGTPGEFVIHNGLAMYYCETTATGWKVGELPESLRGKSIRLHMVPG